MPDEVYCEQTCGRRAAYTVRNPISQAEKKACGGHLAATVRELTAGALLDRTTGAGMTHVWPTSAEVVRRG